MPLPLPSVLRPEPFSAIRAAGELPQSSFTATRHHRAPLASAGSALRAGLEVGLLATTSAWYPPADVPIWRGDVAESVVGVRAERSVAVLTVDTGRVGAACGLRTCARCPRGIGAWSVGV